MPQFRRKGNKLVKLIEDHRQYPILGGGERDLTAIALPQLVKYPAPTRMWSAPELNKGVAPEKARQAAAIARRDNSEALQVLQHADDDCWESDISGIAQRSESEQGPGTGKMD